jgi:uncharacterized protein YdeI (YjbR/CyaY-like superfamily)
VHWRGAGVCGYFGERLIVPMKTTMGAEKYIANQPDWAQEKLLLLRKIMLDCGLNETVKWGIPVYEHRKNVVGMAAFKNFVSLWFYQGVFLVDEANVLIAAGDATKALRQWRFATKEVVPVERVKQYVFEAMANDEKGLKIQQAKKVHNVVVPAILQEVLAANQGLNTAFLALSTSRQHELCEYIVEAKQAETRQRRLQKVIDLIAQKKGLNDKYKNI